MRAAFKTLKVASVICTALLLHSCGGDKASSSVCGGIQSDGVCVYISSIQPTYNGTPTSNIDTTQDTCGTTPEKFTDHLANLTVGAFYIGGTTNSTQITITSYSITYTLNPTSIDQGPTIPTWSTQGPNAVINVGSSNTFSVNLFDIAQKQYYDTLPPNAGAGFPSYSVTYTLNGVDNYGHPITVSGSTEVTIGDYNNC